MAKLGLGAPRRNAKPQLGKVICGGIFRDFRGQFISVLVDSLLEITLGLRLDRLWLKWNNTFIYWHPYYSDSSYKQLPTITQASPFVKKLAR